MRHIELLDKPLAEQTPVEIDTQLAEIHYEVFRFEAYAAQNRDYIKSERRRQVGPTRRLVDYQKSALQYGEALDTLREQAAPLEAEFTRRGGWTRAFLVANSNGHVHRDMYCSTCYPTTQYQWMVAFSGMDEAEIVEAAGERACTVCYPSAPVEVLSRPTQMFTKAEEAAAARREAAAAKKAAQAEKLIFDADGEHPRDSHGYPLKTKIAARNEFSGLIKSRFSYDYEHPWDGQWAEVIETLRPLLVEAGFDVEKIEKTALKKAAKEKAEGEARAKAMGWAS